MTSHEDYGRGCPEAISSTGKFGFYDPTANVFYEIDCSPEEFRELS
jgi:hypothetical protein